MGLFYRKEIKEWSLVMIDRMKELKPLVACFNGKGNNQFICYVILYISLFSPKRYL